MPTCTSSTQDPIKLPKKHTQRRYAPAEKDTAMAMFLSGMGQQEVSDRLKIPRGTICAWCALGKWVKAKQTALQPIAEVAMSRAKKVIERWTENVTTAVSSQAGLLVQGKPSSLKELDQLCRATSSNVAAGIRLFRLDQEQNQEKTVRVIDVQTVKPTQVAQITETAGQQPGPATGADMTWGRDGMPIIE
jgi:hypothetical protein